MNQVVIDAIRAEIKRQQKFVDEHENMMKAIEEDIIQQNKRLSTLEKHMEEQSVLFWAHANRLTELEVALMEMTNEANHP